ncbi:hypothetical protein QCN27_03795 [Cereibacter sp. SYSU M97828]|nr:hypothetical protein [Cereibacter flavus]
MEAKQMPKTPLMSRDEALDVLTNYEVISRYPSIRAQAAEVFFGRGTRVHRPAPPANNFPGDVA